MRHYITSLVLSIGLILVGFTASAVGNTVNITADGPIHYDIQNGVNQPLGYRFTVTNNLNTPLYLKRATMNGSILEMARQDSITNACQFGVAAAPIPARGSCQLSYQALAPTLTNVSQPVNYLNTLSITDATSAVNSLPGIGVKVTPTEDTLLLSQTEGGATLPELNLRPRQDGVVYVKNTSNQVITHLTITIPGALRDAGVFVNGTDSCLELTSLSDNQQCQLHYDTTASEEVPTANVTITSRHSAAPLTLPVTISTQGHFQLERDAHVISGSQEYLDGTTGQIMVKNTGESSITSVDVTLPTSGYFTTDCQGAELATDATCVITYDIPKTPKLSATDITISGNNSDNNPTLLGEIRKKWSAAISSGRGDVRVILHTSEQGVDTLYAGTNGGGIFKSIDAGANWSTVDTGLTHTHVQAMAIDGSTLYAGTTGGVFKSTDAGASWSAMNTGLTSSTYVIALTIDGSTIYAGTFGEGVFKSTDAGASWSAVNTGLTNTKVQALATDGNTIYAGTYGGGGFKSTDAGANWSAMKTLMAPNLQALTIDDGTIYANSFGDGIFKSTNAGASWSAMNTGLANTYVQALAIDGSTIYAGTTGGVYKSTNAGASWTVMSKGLTNFYILALTIDGSTIYAGTFGGGVFKSTDAGVSWSAVNTGLTSNSLQHRR